MINGAYRFRWVAAALVLFALGITALSLTTLQSRLSDIRTGERSKSAWIVGQLEFEFIRFQRALNGLRAGLIDADEVILRFDILWSRTDLLSSGTVSDRLDMLNVETSTLSDVRDLLVAQEATVMEVATAGSAEITKLYNDFRNMEDDLHKFSLAVVEATSREAAMIRANLLRMSRITMILSVGAGLALVTLALIFFLDSRHQRRLFSENLDLLTKSQAAAKAKAQFISVVNHELRTPLTSISGSIGLLRGGAVGNLDVQARKLLDIASINCGRLAELINDLLDLDKMASGSVEIERHSVNFSELVAEAVQANENYAAPRGVTLRAVAIEPDIQVMGDKARLIQVLANLLSNAAKYSHSGGEVHVKLCRIGSRARLTVQDFGLGIPAKYQNAVFERFEQVDSSDHRARGGTGLGLSIAKEIVDSHGGTIAVQSREGVGSTFTVYLGLCMPLTSASADGSAREPRAAIGKPVVAA